MGTKKKNVGRKDVAEKLKLKKETVKDLSVKEGAAQAVKGAHLPRSFRSCAIVCF